MNFTSGITGLILAGGRGTRMGHVDKGLQAFRGATMAAHVFARLSPQVGQMAINANAHADQYAVFDVPVWADELDGHCGPLAGLAAGMRRCGTELLMTTPCDSPFLPPDLVARLYRALCAQQADLALAETIETDASGTPKVQPHPVFSLVRTTLLPQLSAYLAAGGRKMDGWHDAITVVRVRFEQAEAFRNINTLAELHAFDAT